MSVNLSWLTNQFLLGLPLLPDAFFSRSVVYICEHNAKGAIGLVINRPLSLNLAQVFKRLKIDTQHAWADEQPVLCGGPVHPERGFVIHTPPGTWQSSLCMDSKICVTVSEDILSAIARNQGPAHAMFSLGYVSWTSGQLEKEIHQDYWLVMPADLDILFTVPFTKRWKVAMLQLGVDVTKLVYVGGHV